MPVVVLFENQVPSVFTGNIEDEDEVLVRQQLLLLRVIQIGGRGSAKCHMNFLLIQTLVLMLLITKGHFYNDQEKSLKI